MKYGNERKWNDRYADCPINEQQAMLWRQQTRPQSAAQYRAQQRTSGSAAVSEGAVRNPWLENLPKAAPRGRKKGLAIFVALIALMLGVSAAYWGVFGVPERTSGGAYAGELSSKKELTSIPVISGGDTRLIVQKEHGETLSEGQSGGRSSAGNSGEWRGCPWHWCDFYRRRLLADERPCD